MSTPSGLVFSHLYTRHFTHGIAIYYDACQPDYQTSSQFNKIQTPGRVQKFLLWNIENWRNTSVLDTLHVDLSYNTTPQWCPFGNKRNEALDDNDLSPDVIQSLGFIIQVIWRPPFNPATTQPPALLNPASTLRGRKLRQNFFKSASLRQIQFGESKVSVMSARSRVFDVS